MEKKMTDYTDADYINICNKVRDSAEDVGEDWAAESAENCLEAIGKYNWKELIKSDLANVMEVYHEVILPMIED